LFQLLLLESLSVVNSAKIDPAKMTRARLPATGKIARNGQDCPQWADFLPAGKKTGFPSLLITCGYTANSLPFVFANLRLRRKL
jgi:hypothetical protein